MTILKKKCHIYVTKLTITILTIRLSPSKQKFITMRKFLILLTLTTNLIFAQETCESPEETFEDLNAITKCSIAPSNKTDGKHKRQISVKISAPKKRYLKKRVIERKVLATSGISQTAHASEISNSIQIKKEDNAIDNILALSNSLSREEIKKALKFENIQNIPRFSNCNSSNKSEELSCFNSEMVKHIEKYFNYPNEALIKKIEGKVWVRFIIDKNGNVSNIKTLGPKGGKVLDNEAIRVVSKLPKFIPGNTNGEKVSVKYGFPISFSLNQ